MSKQDPDFCHKAIELYILKRKKDASDRNLIELEEREAAELADVASSMQQLAASSPRQQSESPTCEAVHVQEDATAALPRQDDAGALQQQDVCALQQEVQVGSTAVQQIAALDRQASNGVLQSPQQQQEQQQAVLGLDADGGAEQQQQQHTLSWQSRRQGVECARLLAGVQVPQS